MNDRVAPPDLIDAIAREGRISAQTVRHLREEVFCDGATDRREAKAIFQLDRACTEKDPEWSKLYVDALTDYFVWKSVPKKYVDEDGAAFLIENLLQDGKITSDTELELLINVVHWAVSCPDSLSALALQAVSDSVLNPDAATYAKGRHAGVIDRADVELLAKVLYSGGGEGGFTVSRAEAEALFDLNDKTDERANDQTWRHLFVKGIANYLMFPTPAPAVPSAEEALRREAWLEERRGVGELLTSVGKNVIGLDYGRVWREADPFGRRASAAKTAETDAKSREADRREAIDAPEAAWLLDRIADDLKMSENEKALLRFIKDNATAIDPSLDKLLTRI